MSFSCRIAIDGTEVPVDERRFRLLRLIQSRGSISRAAEEAGIPYRSALAYIKNLEELLGEEVVETRRGGKGGGGGSRLTETGIRVVLEYLKLKRALERQISSNEIRGTVEEISGDGSRIRVGNSLMEAPMVEGLSPGDEVILLVDPEDIVLMGERYDTSMRNIIPGTVTGLELDGDTVTVRINAGDIKLKTRITRESQRKMKLNPGSDVYAGFKAVAVTVLKI
ncbi:TOBE domain-containing protein [Methanothermobacter sp. KEPCO-1]|uniref:TOBE domain-containing protein n=1 Tax=unclassified Methanothermobacter TaxID=2631116 RepID=UPI0011C8432C|nr:TOBE domain-containing protein [Methanothermobacter sp. KEPCO-1]QEF94437.1 LysR family transcriptional regulator [Methanothermobacter sp. KEPCO-1]